MPRRSSIRFAALPFSTCIALAIFVATPSSHADEGMWLFNDLPRELLEERYDFTPDPAWAEHVMKSSVRFNSGGSGSFVSSRGLVLTNHHVAADTLHKVSTPENNYHEDSFLAESPADEIPAPDLELNQLVSIEDVTDRVNAAVTDDMPPAEAVAARRAVMAEIETESLDATGLRSDVVTLYQGGRYHLYRYKKFTDVRLVFAPESAIAFFGGDPDNFEYPRYCLDVCIFRVYENDAPAKVEHFLAWSTAGADDGELVFVSGNPGRTSRLYTTAALEFMRDIQLPFRLENYRRREINLQQFGNEGTEQERRARDELFGIENGRKALTGMLAGLQDPALMARKAAAEAKLREQVAARPELADHAAAWDTISEAKQVHAEIYERQLLLERGLGLNSTLFDIARTLLRMAEEDAKPSAERLREFRDSARESLNQQLFSTAPIYPDLEQAKLADSLALLVEKLGAEDPLVIEALAGKSPRARAAQLVGGTALADVDARRRLAEGGNQAIQSATDPMVELARTVDAASREVREQYEQRVEEPLRQAYAQIADAIFNLRGTSVYPDATFTLRLAFGVVKGYAEGGEQIPPWTVADGAFQREEHHDAESPWKLPESWHERRDHLDPETPMNFVCTADIIGGNSGSPVVNRKGELVGLIFDGNIQSLTSDYIYTDEVARAVSVHSSIIPATLRAIYGATALADELGQ